MKIFCTASKDTYITDKIINGNLRAEDANVGLASTLDLFRLWDETRLSGAGSQNELSRVLVKFDYGKLQELTSSILDLTNFTATLKLFDINTGNPNPTNFNLSVIPLSQSFEEGIGRDTSGFDDLDSCNFLTASISAGSPVLWFMSGANQEGHFKDPDIDIFSYADFSDGLGSQRVEAAQNFINGSEALSVDVTKIVSASVAGQMANHGFRVSFSGSEESDTKTRFVKRFASRHVSNPYLRPHIEVSFDDSIQDNRENFLFNLSGSLFLNSYTRSGMANLVSGSALTPITGDNSLLLKLKSGSYEFITTASQRTAGTIDSAGNNIVTGSYVANFAIDTFGSSSLNSVDTMEDFAIKSGSIVFDEYWYSFDGNVGFHTGSIKIKANPGIASGWLTREPAISLANLERTYSLSDRVRLRLFGRDLINEQNTPVKRSYKLKPVIFEEVYYKVKDASTNKTIIDFGESDNSTRVSTDSDGMFFDLHMDTFSPGRIYNIEFLVIDRGNRSVVSQPAHRFKVS